MNTLEAARHVARAARAAAGTPQRAHLAWCELAGWPAWALPEHTPPADALALRVAALWQAPALRRCIDGRVWQAASRAVGDTALEAATAVDAVPPGARCGALPPAERLQAQWEGIGRALLLATIDGPLQRGAVAAALQWDEALPPGHALPETRLLQALVARAQSLPGAAAGDEDGA